jgi:pimeloyl-ACP methyl ester carboxylesterase
MASKTIKRGSAAIVEPIVHVPVGDATLEGELIVPAEPIGVVLFAHGSGSSRHSPRNAAVADHLRRCGLATLLMDLLTRREEAIDIQTAQFRFDIDLLARRVGDVTRWLADQHELPIGYFGASTGAAAALAAAAAIPQQVSAIVSRGGRPDLAGDALPLVKAPTLFIVGERDPDVLDLNRQAIARMACETNLVVVPGATHLFEEPGTLEHVARLARTWFVRYLQTATP